MDILALSAILAQVLLIDLVLAGDNAIVIALSVAKLSPDQRRTAILAGIGGAMLVRILFALVAVKLMAIIGLTLAGGVLLLWVAWKTARELKGGEAGEFTAAPVSLKAAIWRIVMADISMSLDNVLGVAGAARGHMAVLALGLVLSVGLMGLAAAQVARLMQRFPGLAWGGIAIVAYVALDMIWTGWHEVAAHFAL
ncbi:YjbE family putative metal transport protein [Acidocella sp.]|uniref:YjbE family putative metal transport protein n=1 Tax=Acidocella sp. TaxID=50710 RepID=UPI00261C444C|nr:YjbE family putative metal transport protein [Acidocella sp.]